MGLLNQKQNTTGKTAVRTSKAPTSKARTSKAPTSKAPTSKAPTSKAPTSKAPTSKAPKMADIVQPVKINFSSINTVEKILELTENSILDYDSRFKKGWNFSLLMLAKKIPTKKQAFIQLASEKGNQYIVHFDGLFDFYRLLGYSKVVIEGQTYDLNLFNDFNIPDKEYPINGSTKLINWNLKKQVLNLDQKRTFLKEHLIRLFLLGKSEGWKLIK